MPHKVNHPDLGEIWIGGTMKKHIGRTPPARYIESEAFRNMQFVLYCASQFPKVEIDEITVTPSTGDLLWVDVTVKNDRVYPTISDRDLERGWVDQDRLTFSICLRPGAGNGFRNGATPLHEILDDVDGIVVRLPPARPELPLTRALQAMIDASTKSLPVLEQGRLVGIVAREDVLRAIRRAAEGQGPD